MSNASTDTSLKASLQRYNAAIDAELKKHVAPLKKLKNEKGGYELFLQDTQRTAEAKAKDGVDFTTVDLDNPNISFTKFSAPAKGLTEAALDKELDVLLREDNRRLSAVDLAFKQDYLALKIKMFDDKIYDIESEIISKVEKLTKELLKALPMELQWIKGLYAIGEYDQAVELIEKYLQIDQSDTEALSAFLKENAANLESQLTAAAILSLQRSSSQTFVSARAKKEMRDNPAGALLRDDFFSDDISDRAQAELENYKRDINFDALPEETRKALIEQRKYVIELGAQLDVSNIPPDDATYLDLQSYYKRLQANINNALLNQKNVAHGQADFETIKADIEKRRSEIYRKAFRHTFFTSTNAKAASMMAASYFITPFMSTSSSIITKVFILATLPALYVQSDNQAHDIADRNIKARAELISDENIKDTSLEHSNLKPVDIEYIYTLDNEFNVKSAKEMAMPNQNQRVITQLFGGFIALWGSLPVPAKRVIAFLAIIAPFAISAPLAPAIWPALVISGLVLSTIGAALVNVPVTKYVKQAFGGIPKVATSIPLTSELSKPSPSNVNLIAFNSEQKASLNQLYKGLAEIVSKHFEDRLDELASELDSLINSPELDNDRMQKLTQEITQLEKDWEATEQSIGNPKEFCKVMNSHIQRTYLAEREDFLRAKKAGVHLVKRKNLIFSGQESGRAAALKPAPSFNMDSQQEDYMLDREPLEDIVRLHNVIKHIDRGLSA